MTILDNIDALLKLFASFPYAESFYISNIYNQQRQKYLNRKDKNSHNSVFEIDPSDHPINASSILNAQITWESILTRMNELQYVKNVSSTTYDSATGIELSIEGLKRIQQLTQKEVTLSAESSQSENKRFKIEKATSLINKLKPWLKNKKTPTIELVDHVQLALKTHSAHLPFHLRREFSCVYDRKQFRNKLEERINELNRYLHSLDEEVQSEKKLFNELAWKHMIHKSISEISKKKFQDGHYADAVESAFKEVNCRVKDLYMKSKPDLTKELDGLKLMRQAFKFDDNDPVVKLSKFITISDRDRQDGYMQLFAGSMQGIRNPKAHENITLHSDEAIHMLFLASHLLNKLDEAKEYNDWME